MGRGGQESIDEPQDVGNMESIKAKILALVRVALLATPRGRAERG